VLSAEEKVARNRATIARSSLEVSKNELKDWLSDKFYTLNNLWLQMLNIASALKHRTLIQEECNNLLSEQEITDGNISLTDERKRWKQA
jgi:hypothetical protein